MSHSPPSYEHPRDEEESVGLLKHDQDGQDSRQEDLGLSDLAGPSSTSHPAPIPIIYLWRPRYPIKERDEDAMGLLGKDRRETVEMVREAFPYLKTVDEERIILSTKRLNQDGQPIGWVKIMTPAWSTLAATLSVGMGEIRIQLEDGPGDYKLSTNINPPSPPLRKSRS